MCCACPVTSALDNPFNALPENWASDPELLAGLRVDRTIVAAYALSGFCAGVTAVILVALTGGFAPAVLTVPNPLAGYIALARQVAAGGIKQIAAQVQAFLARPQTFPA